MTVECFDDILGGLNYNPVVAVKTMATTLKEDRGDTSFHERRPHADRDPFSNLQEVAKKRTRRVVKSQRAIVGASLDVIKERRAQRPEARAAARQQAIKDAKEKKAANESRKRAEKAKAAASGAKPAQRIQSKQGAKGSAPKVAAKSR